METEKHLAIITEGIKIKGTVLEIGCGEGRLLAPLADKYPRAKFIGFDNDVNIFQKAPRRKNIVYTNQLPKEKIDFAYSMLTFQHIPSEIKKWCIEEVSKLLKPDGVFRFQFVRGDYQGNYDHNASIPEITGWCLDAGFEPVITQGEGLWNWCSARKK
jgi:trans-aconitate methyltransferase